jgi:TetR/AcrR family transcriptional regulator, transcriptional repressor for nem operon
MKGVETKEKIISKSAELFNLYGYHRCSLQDIMDATNLKKGGIYNHFKNKDEIALAAFEYSFNLVLKRFRDRINPCTSVTQKLYAIIRTFADYIDDPVFKGGCPLINTALDTTDSYPALRDKAKEALNKLETYISIKLKEGIASNEFKSTIKPDEVASFMIATFEGAIIVARLNDNNKYLKLAVRHMEEYIQREIIK